MAASRKKQGLIGDGAGNNISRRHFVKTSKENRTLRFPSLNYKVLYGEPEINYGMTGKTNSIDRPLNQIDERTKRICNPLMVEVDPQMRSRN